MRVKEVIKLLRVTRPTLWKWRNSGKLKATKLPNGTFDYDRASVFAVLNSGQPPTNAIYCRVSTQKQKPDLKNQQEMLESFCRGRGVEIHHTFIDIGSGLDLDRKGFRKLFDLIQNHKIQTLYISYKDRLTSII